MVVLVNGGAGYIGTHTVVELINAGHSPIVADNFSNSSPVAIARVEEITGKKVPLYNANLCDKTALRRIFEENKNIEAVIHFAGYKAVAQSTVKPLLYYENNVGSAVATLQVMEEFGCCNFVFSSSATVYGTPESLPMKEFFGFNATSPYSATKITIENILQYAAAANAALNAVALRYFNPIGAHPSGRIGEDPKGVPNNLVPYIAQTAAGLRPFLQVYGNDYPTPDGTCIRDYIHVVDLAKGHVAALAKLQSCCGLVAYNLGTGKGSSVLEVLAAYSKAAGKAIPYKFAPRRAGDIAEYYADATLAKKELGWQATHPLFEMCESSWNWQKNNPNGYEG